MITEEQEKFILKNMTEFYHVPKQNSHLFGEPFFENNYLYYYDGSAITFITERVGKETDGKSLNRTIKLIADKHKPDSLLAWGETPIKKISLRGYKEDKEDIPLWKTELRFHAKEFKPNKRFRNYLSKAKRLGFKLKPVKSNYYKNEYMKLIADSHTNLLRLKSISYYCVYPLVPQTRFAEILQDNKMVAVYILTDVTPRYLNLSEIGYDKNVKNASGLASVMLMDYYLDKTEILSWGGCANKGIFDYKRHIIGDVKYYRYKNLVWYNFYKKKQHVWWIGRMKSKNV